MKKQISLLAISILLTFNLFAQKNAPPPVRPNVPINEETKMITYEEVVNLEGVNKDELRIRLDAWFKGFFKNAPSVLQEQTNDMMLGKHAFNIYKDVDGQKVQAGLVKYTFRIGIKDGKYKYTLSDIFLFQSPKLPVEKWLDENSPNKADNYNYLNQTDTFMKDFVASLKKAMSEGKKVKKDDW